MESTLSLTDFIAKLYIVLKVTTNFLRRMAFASLLMRNQPVQNIFLHTRVMHFH